MPNLQDRTFQAYLKNVSRGLRYQTLFKYQEKQPDFSVRGPYWHAIHLNNLLIVVVVEWHDL